MIIKFTEFCLETYEEYSEYVFLIVGEGVVPYTLKINFL